MPAFNLSPPAATVVITALTATIWTILVWHIRLFVRTKIRGPFSWDDLHCTIATVLGILNSSIIISEARYGLGDSIDNVLRSEAHRQSLLAWIAALLYILALCFSMLSVCCLIVRINRRTSQAWLARVIAIVTSMWAVVAFFVIAFICRLPHPWITRPLSRCIDIYHAWMFIAIVNALLDLANIFAALVLLWSVRMPLRTKVLVLILFAMRLLVIPPTLTRLRYIKKVLSSKNWTYARVDVVIVTQVVLHLSIILTTMPCIKPYLSAFESGALRAPTVDQRQSLKRPANESRLGTTTPVTQPRPALHRRDTSHGMKSTHTIASALGRGGHRKGFDERPPRAWCEPTTNVTTVQHDPEEAREAERRRSKDSVSSRYITRTQSFSIKFEDAEGLASRLPESRAPTPVHTLPLEYEDVGGLLNADPHVREEQRKDSQHSI